MGWARGTGANSFTALHLKQHLPHIALRFPEQMACFFFLFGRGIIHILSTSMSICIKLKTHHLLVTMDIKSSSTLPHRQMQKPPSPRLTGLTKAIEPTITLPPNHKRKP